MSEHPRIPAPSRDGGPAAPGGSGTTDDSPANGSEAVGGSGTSGGSAAPAQRATSLQRRFGARAATRPTDAKSSGFGRVVIVIYAVFSLSAGVRSLYQLATEFSRAPLAIVLSALAAVIYVVATVALTRTGERWHRVATVAVTIEAVGVLAVGALSVAAPQLFPKASVWSHFGAGYGYVPLVLPAVGLFWLWRTRPGRTAARTR